MGDNHIQPKEKAMFSRRDVLATAAAGAAMSTTAALPSGIRTTPRSGRTASRFCLQLHESLTARLGSGARVFRCIAFINAPAHGCNWMMRTCRFVLGRADGSGRSDCGTLAGKLV